MGTQQSLVKCNFEDVQNIIIQKGILINTLHDSEQICLIEGSIHSSNETKRMNSLLQTNKNSAIIIYGRNTNDISVRTKYEQLIQLGFSYVSIYPGGLFEWLCLQDIFGKEDFPTTSNELDILKYKPSSIIKNNNLLTNS